LQSILYKNKRTSHDISAVNNVSLNNKKWAPVGSNQRL
jgi:hypothetical protein